MRQKLDNLLAALLFFAFLVWAGSIWVGEMMETTKTRCTRYEIASGECQAPQE